ncbi:Transcriptional regulator, AcrR family [hydrothermal vent metagenome]|uniref:Transcriptional regulator, AcrR family n=1 Tax=hydrothermal vent metagenome TaxID=652676 RepID=A0A3B0YG54_9ZZZZ
MARTIEFDCEEVLEKAMQLFWKNGYAATSMAQLEKSLGINKFSIYNTFGNKHQLFIAALNRYDEQVMHQILTILGESPHGLPAIDRALDLLEKNVEGEPLQYGCLMLNSGAELSPHDIDVSAKIRNMNRSLEDAFYEALASAQQQGEMAQDSNLKEAARFLITLYQGMVMVAKNEQDSRTVQSSIRFAKKMLRKF